MTDQQKLEKVEFLLRNYQATDEKSLAKLLDEIWWIVVEGKYKPGEGGDETV